MLQKFTAYGKRGALVGSTGHGKTTLLTELAEVLQRQGEQLLLLRLREGERNLSRDDWTCIAGFTKLPADSAGRTLLLDGAEQLSRWNWWRLRRRLPRSVGLLITSHRARMLPTLCDCQTSVLLLLNLVEQLQGPVTAEQARELTVLFEIERGDVRLCLRTLYDRFAEGSWTPIGLQTE